MKNKQYEAMFLFDPTFGANFENCETEIRRIMDRAEAKIVFCKKWDERRLAYRLKGRKRGVYVLTYFNGPAGKISSLERDAQLSEDILRVLVLKAEEATPESMERAMTAQAPVADDRDGGSWGDRDRDRHRDRDRDRGRSGGGGADARRLDADRQKPEPASETKPEIDDVE